MIWIVAGLALWTAAHLFKRVLPKQREALGKLGRPIVTVLILAAVGLMILGYRAAEEEFLYALPECAWYANNLLMLIALFLMDIGRAKGIVRTWIRHPMLLGVVVWSVAHLLVNGDVPSLILFGGLGLWALLEMAVISHAEGDWQRPARGRFRNDAVVAVIACVLYAGIVWIHNWLDHPALILF